MSVYQWDTTALNNENADPSINWTENQNSNTVNNSARAMMAAVAALIKVISGQATSGGAANAYTLTSPSGHAFTTYITGMMVCFRANHDNTAAATLNVDGLGAKSLRKYGSTNVVAGDIETDNLIFAIYDGVNFQVLNNVANNNVQAFSALSGVADRYPYFDGPGSLALGTITALARSLLDDASASAMRTTLELASGATTTVGSLATQNTVNNNDWSGTDLAVGNGGTGASNASGARLNLGIPENTRTITFGTGAPPALGTGQVYLRHN